MARVAQSLATSLADSLATSLAGGDALPFSKAIYSNANARHLLAKNPATGIYTLAQFAANVLATRIINGIKYGQVEAEYSTLNDYSEALDQQFTSQTDATWNTNAANDPLGNATMDKLEETSDTGVHRANGLMVDPSGTSFIGVFAKADERDTFSMRVDGNGAAYLNIEFDLGTETVTALNGTPDYSGMLSLGGGIYFCYYGYPDTVAGGANRYLYLSNGSSYSYAGTTGYGMYFGMFNNVVVDHLVSYITADGSTETKPADPLYFPIANVPAGMKDKFTVKFIPNYNFPTQISQNKTLWAHGSVYCILSSSGTITVIEGVTQKVQATGVTCNMHDIVSIEFDRVNGDMTLSGFTAGNGTYNGTAWTAPSTDFYWGCNTSGLVQIDGLISEPQV